MALTIKSSFSATNLERVLPDALEWQARRDEHLWDLGMRFLTGDLLVTKQLDPKGKFDRHLVFLVHLTKIDRDQECAVMLANEMLAAVRKGDGKTLRTIATLCKIPTDEWPREYYVARQLAKLRADLERWPTKAELRESCDPDKVPDYGCTSSWNRIYKTLGILWLKNGQSGRKPVPKRRGN